MDKPSFIAVVAEHSELIVRTLRALRVPLNDLSDVMQDVLTAVYRGLPAFDPAEAARPEHAVRCWVIGICRRHAANHHRVVRRRREHLCPADDLDLVPARTPDNEAAYDARETTQLLFDRIGALCSERRVVVVAHEIEEMPMSQIARMHHLGINTAYNRLRLGRRDLQAGWQRKVR